MRVGIGYDVHKFEEGRKLIIGGVDIPYEKGLAGHSDADVLTHAIIDAICGALSIGDIGSLFPDTDSEYKDIDSLILLAELRKKFKENFNAKERIEALKKEISDFEKRTEEKLTEISASEIGENLKAKSKELGEKLYKAAENLIKTAKEKIGKKEDEKKDE